MAHLETDFWPPAPFETERLKLRITEAGDRPGFLEMMASPVVRAYLGGPAGAVEDLEARAPSVPGAYPGVFAIEHAGGFIGFVQLDRRDRDAPGHIRDEGGELEVGYQLLPAFWGRGFAFEAVTAVLAWAAAALPDDEVVLVTQVANTRSVRLAERLGFVEVERFEAYGAMQWLGRRAM